ncbi:hypothetical protein [Bacillus cytotoxicus]|uniref:hypothetical protein n=1 Tax=Bacillus cytotoxicus TaxID=580165 RepID=UPI00244713B8|nr:hypothetical protein [Bacillus cytotoxicus]MDH2880892.1 hypothetical protein [Bacillus cytotoxicus]
MWKAACPSTFGKTPCEVATEEKDYNIWVSPSNRYYIEVYRWRFNEHYRIYTKGYPLNSTQKEDEKDQSEIQMDQLQVGPENLKQQLERKDKQFQELMTAKATWEKEKTELEKKLKTAEDKIERQTESDAKNTST